MDELKSIVENVSSFGKQSCSAYSCGYSKNWHIWYRPIKINVEKNILKCELEMYDKNILSRSEVYNWNMT